ncbi:YdaU family protein [Comamonas sp. F1-6]|uniref:YdaU family protein n=1 Tax=Comamonas sp. F1-6 TaxID=673550 RepID=UPI0031E0575D
MNHYPHHIGDFNNATRHLTFVERALYRELLDLYYDTEQPLNPDFDKLARRVLATSDELRKALQGLLDEFFTLRDDGWHNVRCDIELAAYLKKQEQQSLAGKASAAKRRGGKKPAPPLAGGAVTGQPGHGGDGEPGATGVERSLNGRTTNQNQNQNHIDDEEKARTDAVVPAREAEWATVFEEFGVQVDHTSIHDRKKFWPLANSWCTSRVTVGQMRSAVARARAEAREPISYLPSYVDRVLATASAPTKPRPGRSEPPIKTLHQGIGVHAL